MSEYETARKSKGSKDDSETAVINTATPSEPIRDKKPTTILSGEARQETAELLPKQKTKRNKNYSLKAIINKKKRANNITNNSFFKPELLALSIYDPKSIMKSPNTSKGVF